MHAAVYWARPRAVQVGVLDPVADAEHARLLCKRARHDLSDHCILHVEADDAVVPTDRFKLKLVVLFVAVHAERAIAAASLCRGRDGLVGPPHQSPPHEIRSAVGLVGREDAARLMKAEKLRAVAQAAVTSSTAPRACGSAGFARKSRTR